MVDKKEEKTFESPEDFDDFMQEEPLADDLDAEEASPEAEPKSKKAPKMADDLGTDIDLPKIEEEVQPEDMLDIAADVPVQVVAVMGKKSITLKNLAAMKLGEVVELGRPANEIVDLVAGGKLIAKGELVEIEGKLGVRIVKMIR